MILRCRGQVCLSQINCHSFSPILEPSFYHRPLFQLAKTPKNPIFYQPRRKLINCWMSALKAKVSAIANWADANCFPFKTGFSWSWAATARREQLEKTETFWASSARKRPESWLWFAGIGAGSPLAINQGLLEIKKPQYHRIQASYGIWCQQFFRKKLPCLDPRFLVCPSAGFATCTTTTRIFWTPSVWPQVMLPFMNKKGCHCCQKWTKAQNT